MPLVLFAFAVLSPSRAPCISDDASSGLPRVFGMILKPVYGVFPLVAKDRSLKFAS